MGYQCKWCKVEHETVYDCIMLECILPPGIPFPPEEFGRRMELLLNPPDEEVENNGLS